MVTERSRSHNFAGVERRPEACTLATVNFAAEPFGITTLPPTFTSFATLPGMLSPTFAVLELTDSLVVMLMAVPAGIVVSAATTQGASRTKRNNDNFLKCEFISVTSQRGK